MNEYHVYAHKQQFQGINSSPPQSIGVNQSIGTNSDLIKAGVTIGIVAKQLAPVTNVLKNNIVNATGNSRLKRNLGYVETGIGFGILAFTGGIGLAAGVAVVKIASENIQSYYAEREAQINSDFNFQQSSTRIKQGVYGGAYYD